MQIIENKEKIEKLRKEIIEQSNDPKKNIYLKDLSGISSKSIEDLLAKYPKQGFRIGIAFDNDNLMHDHKFGPYEFDGCFSGQSVWGFNSDMLLFTLKLMEDIESQINPKWSDKEKAAFIFGYLSTEYTFDMNVINDDSLILKKAGSCTNFSKLCNQLLLRQGIESYVFATHAHAFNVAKINGEFYPIDAASGSLYLEKTKSPPYFGMKDYFKIIEIIDVYEDFSKKDQEKIDSLYFTQEDTLKTLDKVWPKYSKTKREHSSENKKEK